MSALRGSQLYAATWPTDPTELRTLQNSSGVRALALFTDETQLEQAALRYGWLGVDGSVPTRRLHIGDAIRFARAKSVALVVIDIAADHAFELDDGELELVSAPPSTRPSSQAGLAPVLSSMRPANDGTEVKRASARPPPFDVGTSNHASSSGLQPTAVNVDATNHAVSATFSAAGTATMTALPAYPPDALVNELTQVLRSHIEVEWACFVGEAERTDALSIALRIQPAFVQQLGTISAQLRQAAQPQRCEVLVLETPEQMKRAHAVGLPFYPWRKR